MLYIYAVINKRTNDFATSNAKGNHFFKNKANAIKSAEGYSNISVIRYKLEKISNDIKDKSIKVCYQTNYSSRIFYRKKRSWSNDEYSTYIILEDGVIYETMD